MNKLQNPNDNERKQVETDSQQVTYRRVPAANGSSWITDAFMLFKSSIGAWLGIVAFLMLLLLFPFVNNIVSLLMPVAIGGLMIGCKQASKSSPLKFEHLFSGIQTDARELLILSAIYALASMAIMFITYSLLLMVGVDFSEVLPENIEQMKTTELMAWIQGLDQTKLLPMILLAILIWMALMIPLIMAYWFAPALIVLKKISPFTALKLSFKACKDNFIPFLIYGLVGFGYLMIFFVIMTISMIIIPPLAIIVMIAGYLAIFAITLASIYTSYTDIFDQKSSISGNDSDDSDSNSDSTSNSDPDSSMIA